MSVLRWCGFCTVEAKLKNTAGARGPSFAYDVKYWSIPYWSIVTPLTLLSGWLLLSKQRKSPA
jgi:hypothetical protein